MFCFFQTEFSYFVNNGEYDFDEGPGRAGTGGVLGVLRGLLKAKILVAHFFLFVCFS